MVLKEYKRVYLCKGNNNIIIMNSAYIEEGCQKGWMPVSQLAWPPKCIMKYVFVFHIF